MIFIETPYITISKIQTQNQIERIFSKIFFILEDSFIRNFQVFSRKEFDAKSFSKIFKVDLSESLFYQIITQNFIGRKTLGHIINKITQTDQKETNTNSSKFNSKEKIKHENKLSGLQTYIKSNYYFKMKNLHLRISINDDYYLISIYDPFSQKKENYYFHMIPLLAKLLFTKSKQAFEKILDSLFCFKNFIVGRKISSMCHQTTILSSKPIVYQKKSRDRERSFKLKKSLRKMLNLVLFNKVKKI